MPFRLLSFSILLPAVLWLQACATADQPSAAVDPEQLTIETALIPVVTFEGEGPQRSPLLERQAELGVPAVSVAVLRNGELAWAKGYGEGVTVRTQFQAASLSKTIAAAGLLMLAEELGVGVDEDLGPTLPINLAVLNPEGYPLTLRKLLSHTNGAAVSGFPGYPVGSDIPTTAQVVTGEAPTNTAPVTVRPNPQGERRYSGGGYTMAQLWAETVTGEPFAQLMDRLLLKPLGMADSTFKLATPAEAEDLDRVRAFDRTDVPVTGGWHLYPEMAAAGLWTTPTDYLKFVAAVLAGINGRDEGIPPHIATLMSTEVASEYGLGIGVADINGDVRLSHSGGNRGYRCNFMAYPATEDAVLTMTNASAGWPLVGDVGRTANATYGWPASPLLVHKRVPITAEELAVFEGEYHPAGRDDTAYLLTVSGNELAGRTPDGSYTFTLIKIGPTTFVDPQDGEEAELVPTGDGKVQITTPNNIYFKR